MVQSHNLFTEPSDSERSTTIGRLYSTREREAMANDELKKSAAEVVLVFVEDDMVVGVGTGWHHGQRS